MKIMKVSKYLLIVLSLALVFTGTPAAAHNSKAWQERMDIRTATLWIEGQDLGGLVLNARGELSVTWLERGLRSHMEKDNDLHEWIVTNLSYYYSSRKEIQSKLKKRDILVLNYRAIKNWAFDPTKLSVDGKAVALDDVLTRRSDWESENLEPGYTGRIAVAVSPLKPGKKVELRYEDASVVFEVPRK